MRSTIKRMKMNNKKKFAIILALGFILSLALTMATSDIIQPKPHGRWSQAETFHSAKMFLTSFNIILILALLWNYISIYREMSNRFTLSLIIFSLSLLLYALSSSPLFHIMFGFRGSGLGPFQVIPSLFSLTAVIVLLYQSFE